MAIPGRSERDPLDHPIRRCIAETLGRRPGLGFLGLLGELRRNGFPRVAHGSLDWHLRVLGGAGLIVSIRSGRFRRYYPNTAPWTTNLVAYAFLQSPRAYGIATLLLQKPDQTLAEIHGKIPADERGDLDALRYQLGRFIRRGLLETTRRPGFPNVYRARPSLARIVRTLDAFRLPSSLPVNNPGPRPAGPRARPAFPPLTPGAAPVPLLSARSLV